MAAAAAAAAVSAFPPPPRAEPFSFAPRRAAALPSDARAPDGAVHMQYCADDARVPLLLDGTPRERADAARCADAALGSVWQLLQQLPRVRAAGDDTSGAAAADDDAAAVEEENPSAEPTTDVLTWLVEEAAASNVAPPTAHLAVALFRRAAACTWVGTASETAAMPALLPAVCLWLASKIYEHAKSHDGAVAVAARCARAPPPLRSAVPPTLHDVLAMESAVVGALHFRVVEATPAAFLAPCAAVAGATQVELDLAQYLLDVALVFYTRREPHALACAALWLAMTVLRAHFWVTRGGVAASSLRGVTDAGGGSGGGGDVVQVHWVADPAASAEVRAAVAAAADDDEAQDAVVCARLAAAYDAAMEFEPRARDALAPPSRVAYAAAELVRVVWARHPALPVVAPGVWRAHTSALWCSEMTHAATASRHGAGFPRQHIPELLATIVAPVPPPPPPSPPPPLLRFAPPVPSMSMVLTQDIDDGSTARTRASGDAMEEEWTLS